MTTLTAERARELLDYDPATGAFIWRVRPETAKHVRSWNAKYAGTLAGGQPKKGRYVKFPIDGKFYSAHRVAWLIHYGNEPAEQVDHRDGERSNNAIENLREATRAQNCRNAKRPRTNTSGHKGVQWSKSSQTWRARIKVDGKLIGLGHYKDIDAAAAAYAQAAKKHHGEFARVS